MEEKSQKKQKNSFHLRVYDVELLKSLNELLATEKYESMNHLLNCALGVGVEKIYMEFGKKKALAEPMNVQTPETVRLAQMEKMLREIRILNEDIHVLSNSIEMAIFTVLNVMRAEASGEPVSADLIDNGYFVNIPPYYQDIKDKLTERLARVLKEKKV